MKPITNHMDSTLFLFSRFSFTEECLLPGPLCLKTVGRHFDSHSVPMAELSPSGTGITFTNLFAAASTFLWTLLLLLPLPETCSPAEMETSWNGANVVLFGRRKKEPLAQAFYWNIETAVMILWIARCLNILQKKKKIEDGQVKSSFFRELSLNEFLKSMKNWRCANHRTWHRAHSTKSMVYQTFIN